MPWPRSSTARLSPIDFKQRISRVLVGDQLRFWIERHAVAENRAL
jgi:hypothetical protein